MSFAFTGPPSAVIANNNAPHVPTPGDGGLGSLNSHTRTTVVTTRLRSLPLPDRAETSFEKVPLFVVSPDKYCDETHLQVVSLPYLNYALREAEVHKKLALMGQGGGGGGLNANGKRGGADTTASNSIVKEFTDLTPQGVAEKIEYIGYHVAGTGNTDERTGGHRLGKFRLMTSQLQGEIDHVPNIFVPQQTSADNKPENTIKKGDAVGFMVKTTAFVGGTTNWQGEPEGGPDRETPPTLCVQVIPVAGANGSIPMGRTGDESTEGDTYYNDDAGKEIYVPAIFIPVGRVVRVAPYAPPQQSQRQAIYQAHAYEMLKTRKQTLDIYLGVRYPMTWGI